MAASPVSAQDEHEGHDAPAAAGFAPQFTLHGFSDVTLRLERNRGAGAESTATGFALGQFDLFFVSRLADNLSFLGESVFEIEPGELAVDLERMFIKYSWSDQLRLSVGRTHTALGYWNEVFHHGVLLQPSVERPEALKFEDDGGILPVHSVGLELGGRLRAGSWDLDYVGNIANGRGATSAEVQAAQDLNRDKAAGIKLSLVRTGTRRIALGPSFYRDLIPPDPSTPGREGSIAERIAGFHLLYAQHPIEALAEYSHIRHEYQLTDAVHRHDAAYFIVVLKAGRWKPYAGAERLAFAEGDIFFTSVQDLRRVTAGVRFEVSSFNAVKVEYRHDRRPGDKSDALFVQTAFTF